MMEGTDKALFILGGKVCAFSEHRALFYCNGEVCLTVCLYCESACFTVYHVEVDCRQQCRCIGDEVISHQIELISIGVLQERGSNFCELASRTSAMRRDAGMNHKACISDAKG
jgi:hypothetical protein